MKVTVKQVVECYDALDEAKVTKLEESEVIKIVKARKAMRPIVDDYKSFLKDCKEKFKPENWDEIQKKVQQWDREGEKTTLPEEERKSINKILIDYQISINKATKEELEKEVELNVETLKDGSDVKILSNNDWTLNQLDKIEFLLQQQSLLE